MKYLANLEVTRLVAVTFLALIFVLLLRQEEGTPPRTADTDRRNGLHARLRGELGHWTTRLALLESEPQERRPMSMQVAVAFLKERIRVHMRMEEQRLFPLLDLAFARDCGAMTAVWRLQHQAVDLWIDRLDAMALERAPSAKSFVTLGTLLAKLLMVHFDDEDEMLRPIFDARPELIDDWEGRVQVSH